MAKGKTYPQVKELIGGPNIFAFNQVVGDNMEKIKEKDEALHDKIRHSISEWPKKKPAWQVIQQSVGHFRICNSFKGDRRNLEVGQGTNPMMHKLSQDVMSPMDVWEGIVEIVLKNESDVQLLEGHAPAGDLERKIQQWLDEIK